tara:strand:+ start:1223 stop:1780 length:558 start_codon:yes stop_codon:yes gene_type:complete
MAQLVGGGLVATGIYAAVIGAEKVRGFIPYVVESEEPTSGDIPRASWYITPTLIENQYQDAIAVTGKSSKKRRRRRRRVVKKTRDSQMRLVLHDQKKREQEQKEHKEQKMNKGLTIKQAIKCGYSTKKFNLIQNNLEKGDKRGIDPNIHERLKEIMDQIDGAEPFDIARLILTQQQMIDGLSYAL